MRISLNLVHIQIGFSLIPFLEPGGVLLLQHDGRFPNIDIELLDEGHVETFVRPEWVEHFSAEDEPVDYH